MRQRERVVQRPAQALDWDQFGKRSQSHCFVSVCCLQHQHIQHTTHSTHSLLSQHICPLCCEELDLSDREFYPCKCGYQVCMWCWHRIRESESGLCPACRTPYGEDPHQFSAVDIEDVLKANKAATKRKNGEVDRSQLANMRVIRRNLVYAVGLPPWSEETLRRPEYFGQYGKIAKIVMNRSQAAAPRATASAYVTFVHKEDTLACILALDGFYLDNRNIRASYGTSKYCSAFIKNVRCNNPDCTYLHEMGADEDTFTKQEIQAGYVTSGRDVLARQQQIVAEQLRQSGAGSSGPPRKRIGGGGPSGTGRAATSPVFPPPEFDEPAKPSTMLVPPPPAGVTRSSTASGVPALPGKAPAARAASVGTRSPTLSSAAFPAIATRKAPSATAASVVAGVHSLNKAEPADPHRSLTSLTPLKRATKAAAARSASVGSSDPSTLERLTPLRASKKNGIKAAALDRSTPSIGGDIIGPGTPLQRPLTGHERGASLNELGGEPINLGNMSRSGSSSLLGGDVFSGPIHTGSRTAIGSDKWGSVPLAGSGDSSSSLWDNSGTSGRAPGPPGAVEGGIIGGYGGGSSAIGGGTNSSSALASMLGINLPTGSGSLQESSLWNSAPAAQPSPLASLNNNAPPLPGMLNPTPTSNGSTLIGGIPIGGGSAGTIGNSGSRNDIALLQSLLPGVHITSGGEGFGFNNNNTPASTGWNSAPGAPGGFGNRNDGDWNGGLHAPTGQAGAIRQNEAGQNQRRGPGIW